MEALEAILTRRSIRKFTSQPVSDELISQLLNAAMNAPSAGNAQPWHFIVVNDHNILNKIAAAHPHAKMCAEAPLAIVPCADPNLEKHKGFWALDLAAAAENILITTRALGLGSVWVGVYPREDRILALQKILNLPPMIIPLNIIPIGYTDIKQEPQDRFKPEVIHYNRW